MLTNVNDNPLPSLVKERGISWLLRDCHGDPSFLT